MIKTVSLTAFLLDDNTPLPFIIAPYLLNLAPHHKLQRQALAHLHSLKGQPAALPFHHFQKN